MIDKQKALDLLDRAVHQDGYGEDYVYPITMKRYGMDCMYVYDGQPACLVGHALNLAGIHIDVLRSLEYTSPHKEWRLERGIAIDDEAIDVLRAAQDVQDNGKTWGEALDAARSV